MSKIYVITTGSSFKFHIIGTTTSKEDAEKFQKMVPNSRIEEYNDLSENLKTYNKNPIYEISIHKASNTINNWVARYKEKTIDSNGEIIKEDFFKEGTAEEFYSFVFGDNKSRMGKIEDQFMKCGIFIQAENLEKAKKIALDKYYEWKYNKEMKEIE